MMTSRALLWLIALNACVDRAGSPIGEPERGAITTSVDSATAAFAAAQRARDSQRAIAHLAPDFYMYVDGRRSGYDSVVAGMRRTFGTLRHLEPGFADVQVKVLGRDAAVVSLTFRDSMVTVDGREMGFRGATTLVWERRGADWLITYADADHHPVESP
jgi:ketosteroid isomerase-like protein